MAAAKVCRTRSGASTRWLATCRGPSVGTTVTTVSSGAKPSATDRGSHGARGGSSAKQRVYLPGWPIELPSSPPLRAPSTLLATRRSARPIVALARLPEPSTLWVAFIPTSAAIGPLTIVQIAAPPVLVVAAWALKAGSSIAESPASTIGKYTGRHPAMTALMAAFSAVTAIPRWGTVPMTSSGSVTPPASIMSSTRSGVGGTIGRPSVQPSSKKRSWTSTSSISIRSDMPGGSFPGDSCAY